MSDGFVKLPRDLLESPAWRSLSINARRLLDFLMIEQIKHHGKTNGRLLAPRRQLWEAGIGQHHVSPAIEECERLGLLDCRRGVGRHPNTYALTWLKFGDGSPPSNRWRLYECQRALATDECQTALSSSAKQHSQRS